MSNMFDSAWYFDQPLDGWNVSSVIMMIFLDGMSAR